MLAKIGASSAHPGGIAATVRQLAAYPPPPGSRILEVGCGTGTTACYLAAQGYDVVAADLHARMIEKARIRAARNRVQVDFRVADVCDLPFADGTFDLVLIESVTNFCDAKAAMAECCRVLRAGGQLFDREMMVDAAVPEDGLRKLMHYFRMPQIMHREAWLALLRRCGFRSGEVLEYARLDPTEVFADDPETTAAGRLDREELIDEGVILDVELWETLRRHDEVIEANIGYLYSGLIRAVK